MQKWGGWVVVGLVVAMALTGQSNAQEAGSDAPYLYYYSDYYNGIVVERADGTDRRVVGEGQLADKRIGSGPGWSPSGKWFAWGKWVISVDGRLLHTVLDGLSQVVMVWSPVDDLLFAIGSPSQQAWEEATEDDDLFVVFALIDPEKDEIIGYSEVRPDLPYDIGLADSYARTWEGSGNYFFLQWTADGQHVIGIYRDQTGSEFPTSFQVFGVDGSISEKTITEDVISVSPAGDIIYQPQDGDSVVVENLIDGSTFEFPAPEEESWSYKVMWHPSGEYGLLDPRNGLWLIMPKQQRIEEIRAENGSELGVSSNSMGHWSPDGTYALLYSNSASYILEAQTGVIIATTLSRGYWSGDYRVTSMSSDNDICTLTDYDVRSGEITLFSGINCVVNRQISFDRQYTARVRDRIIIQDIGTGDEVVLRPHNSDGPLSSSDGQIYWHSRANWFITVEDPTVGESSNIRWMGVASADGLVRRDFTFCQYDFRCVNWLPDRVDSADIPVPLRSLPLSPEHVLEGSNRWFSLTWSPDGKQIAGFEWQSRETDRVIVWDIAGNAPIGTLEDAGHKEIEWEPDMNGEYKPVLVPGQAVDIDDLNYVLAESPDGSQIILRYPGRVLDASTLEAIAIAPIQLHSSFEEYAAASYSPDGSLLAVGGSTRNVSIWDTQSWEPLASLDTASLAVAFSPDGTKLAVGSSWDIQIWDVAEVLAWGREIEDVD